MQAKKLKAGEYYAHKYSKWCAALKVELLSTEPHCYSRGENKFVPGRRSYGFRNTAPTYLVRWSDGDAHVVQARELIAPWAEYEAEQRRKQEAAKKARLAQEEARKVRMAERRPKIDVILDAADEAGVDLSHYFTRDWDRGSVTFTLSLDDLYKLA